MVLLPLQVATRVSHAFAGHIFRSGQEVALDFEGTPLKLVITEFTHVSVEGVPPRDDHDTFAHYGVMTKATSVTVTKGREAPIELFGGTRSGAFVCFALVKLEHMNTTPWHRRTNRLFDEGFNFEKLGIGGLDREFAAIFRRAFASRLYPGFMREVGQNHVRGMLLYGPPGCGKTLIARKIGQALHAKEPKVRLVRV